MIIMRSKDLFVAAILTLSTIALQIPAQAAVGDTTWVRTFNKDFYNWATAHVDTFTLPESVEIYSKIVIFYTIGCPSSPADCDPWDRLGYLQVLHNTGKVDSNDHPVIEPYEIARIVTPYDITGSGRPETCTWTLDVTDYKTLLRGEVVLSNYIESWIGGDNGWLVTIDFAFVEGPTFLDPYKVVNLWQDYYILFGDPTDPVEDYLYPLSVDIDQEADQVKLRVITTGHGQGNTHNCAEFCNKEHTLSANGDPYPFRPWRYNCNQNPCSPQGGTWQFNRAGWCPGDAVYPWDQDITSSVTAGEKATLDYDIEPYENLCRPTNPDCISGITCPDCNYNYTGHTPPHYSIQSQLIFYESRVYRREPQAASIGSNLPVNPGVDNPPDSKYPGKNWRKRSRGRTHSILNVPEGAAR
jgi:hypothetical protein